MRFTANNDKNPFYNISELNSIPIEDVCHQLGLYVKRNGSHTSVKLRNEKTVSAIINVESNTIYDFGDPYIFGTNKTGGPKAGKPLDLIKYFCSCDFQEACKLLADMYNIKPIKNTKISKDAGLSFKEYAQIGICGDVVSKNFKYIPDASTEELFNMADMFSMSVNELRNSKKEGYDVIYEDVLLRNKALPFIQHLRNDYFISIWEEYSFLKDVDALELFDTVCSKPEIIDMYKKINDAEKIFNRAAEGTNLKKIPIKDYSPDKILNDILEKRIKPELGSHNYLQIKNLANQTNCKVKYEVIEQKKYYAVKEQLENFPNRVFLKGDLIILGYLSKDIKDISMILGRDLDNQKKKSFNDMLAEAENNRSIASNEWIDRGMQK